MSQDMDRLHELDDQALWQWKYNGNSNEFPVLQCSVTQFAHGRDKGFPWVSGSKTKTGPTGPSSSTCFIQLSNIDHLVAIPSMNRQSPIVGQVRLQFRLHALEINFLTDEE
eukprot:TRINITY_DN66334_c2_g1_i1.p3 TRINITY_DN66334_c2_g1~~TRINITY_DN66334_c2_g1_i1.p3  ORF type:complete len:111 (+),score=2.20 TRINITY_DN66334_c2_g1_i1:225-557(+)